MFYLIYFVDSEVIDPKCFLINNPKTASTSEVLKMLCQGLLPPDLLDTENYKLRTLINLYP